MAGGGGDKKKRGNGGGNTGGGSGGGANGFKSLGLSESVYHGIVRMGFRMPTPVQRKALPVILTGADACVMARTGSGKTLAFLCPILEKLLKSNNNTTRQSSSSCRAVILSPTRELSMQTLKVLTKLAHFTDLKAVGIHGGEGMEKQFDLLASKPDIIVATPGRLAHHLTEIPDFNLSNCMMCVLDEGDRCMEMGFAQQIRQIARTMPEQSCQKVILSATMPKILLEFTKSGFCTDPQVVRLDQECSVSEELRIAFLTCRSSEKDAALLHVLSHIQQDWEANAAIRTGLTILFCATRHHVEYLHLLLEASGYSATLIYGTLDQDARKANLAAFRSGRKSVLVVTDVAARGIDVPLVDHVIHYHFPPDAKLFVHRSGRAARAGRIGFCWGLVDPDEMPYMIDLHLFLGRHPKDSTTTTTTTGDDDDDDDGNNDDGSEKQKQQKYTLQEMTPDMVHYGSLPVSILNQEVEAVHRLVNSEEFTGSRMESESLQALSKVCNNAMKQYRRTRPEASRDAVRRAKGILEGTRLASGQRLGKGRIPTHPLLRGTEEKMYLAAAGGGNDNKGSDGDDGAEKNGNHLHSLNNFRNCESLLEEIAAFRPKETVFEAFATGVGKDVGVASQVDKGRTTSGKKTSSAAALTAMKNMRRQMKTVRSKGAALVVAGSTTAQKLNEDVDENEDNEGGGGDDDADLDEVAHPPESESALKTPVIIRRPKKFLSKAERRRQAKARKSSSAALDDKNIASVQQEPIAKSKKRQTATDFRDNAFYIDNDLTANTEEAQRARKIEAAMQPSASMKGIAGAAFRMEEAMLDVVGDENEELVQKQRMMRWDKSKRKYVQTTVGAELRGDSKSKKMRLESGQLVTTDKMKLGELYTKWQKKTNRSIGRDGVFDDAAVSGGSGNDRRSSKTGQKGERGDGMKSAVEIKKERTKKEKMKFKNMKKGDKKRHKQKQRHGMNKRAPFGSQGGSTRGKKSR